MLWGKVGLFLLIFGGPGHAAFLVTFANRMSYSYSEQKGIS